MNLASGIFTAPRPESYFFSFSGFSGSTISTNLFVNGNAIGTGHSHAEHYTFTLQSTLHLNAGDQVSVEICCGSGYLYEDGYHCLHFTRLALARRFVLLSQHKIFFFPFNM